MNHAPILPILIPFVAGLLQLISTNRPILRRAISTLALLALLAAAGYLLWLTDHRPPLVYALGNWPAPFGIVLVADRLAALGVMVSAVLAAAALLYASGGFDRQGRHFHAVFQLQLVGINGAFLTGDVFNLFVFFEIMLLASYILLMHGDGRSKSRAGFAYVTLNLAGSAIFLIALGMIYGTLGTLNLADIALQLQQVPATQAALVRLACALLISVFLLKSALLPLSFWLPQAYSAAGAPVAALFAIMTKVGIVAILRLQVIALAPAAATGDLVSGWLVWAALATLLFTALGILTAKRLQALIAWLVLGSAATLLVVVPLANDAVTSAALFYLTQSALVAAAFFLLGGLIGTARGHGADRLMAIAWQPGRGLKLAFLLLAMTAAGLPPFSGFLGKLMLLASVSAAPQVGAIWAVLLSYGLVTIIGLTKAGNRLFWEGNTHDATAMPTPDTSHWRARYATAGLILIVLLLPVCAQPIDAFARRAAVQLHEPQHYIQAVIPAPEDISRSGRP